MVRPTGKIGVWRCHKKAQVHFLNELPQEGKLLIIGGGTGWILNEIVRIRPKLKIDFVEASSKMIALAENACFENPNIRFVHGSEKIIPEVDYHGIITNFFLDVFCEDRLKEVMLILKIHLHKNGIWLCADFQRTQRVSHFLLLKLMQLFFSATTRLEVRSLLDFRFYFNQQRLKMVASEYFYSSMIFSRAYKRALK